MPVERSAGAVIFRRSRRELLYLLLHYEEGHWDFPKGHIEPGEKTEETIRREILEETGISRLVFIDGFKETIRYFFWVKKLRILKFVVYFLAKTAQKGVRLSKEHIGFEWLPFTEAQKRLTFATSRKILKKAHTLLTSPA